MPGPEENNLQCEDKLGAESKGRAGTAVGPEEKIEDDPGSLLNEPVVKGAVQDRQRG